MANIVEEIKRPINDEMKLLNRSFMSQCRNKVALLDKVTRFIVTTKGKQMRPMFVFLCAKLVGEVTEKNVPRCFYDRTDPHRYSGT